MNVHHLSLRILSAVGRPPDQYCRFRRSLLRTLQLVVAFFAFISLAQAQEGEPIHVRFSLLAWEPIKQGLHYASGGEVEELRIPSEYRSDLYRYEGPPEIVFFRTRTGPDGETVREPAARATIDSSVRRPLFLFFPKKGGGDVEFRILTIDDSPDAFPAGSYRFFNFTDHRIGGEMADEQFVIQEGENKTVRPSAENNRNLSLQLAVENPGGWERKVSTRWLYRDTARHLVFLVRDGRRLAIRSIPQYQVPINEPQPDE